MVIIMRCNVCGRQIMNEQANFCEYCGSSFREQVQQTPYNMAPVNNSFPYGNAPMPNGNGMQGNPMPGVIENGELEKPVSFLDWLLTYGITLIPFVGWLIYLIMLFIWSFSSETPKSKKNWARATLIVTGLIFIIVLAFLVLVYIPFSMDIYQQMQSGTFDFNSYYNNLYK